MSGHDPAARWTWAERRSAALALVFTGGTLGTAAREALALAFPSADGVPRALWAINVGGSLVLGCLLGMQTSGSTGLHRGLRLAVGTGFCGGFTTYSALSVAGADLIGRDVGGGLVYVLTTLLAGAVAAWAGLLLGAAVVRRRAVAGQADWVDPDVDDVPGDGAAAEATP